MRNKLIVLAMILVVIFTMFSCVNDKNVPTKNPTGTFKSDNEDYVIPGVFIDIREEEAKGEGDTFGEIIIIP